MHEAPGGDLRVPHGDRLEPPPLFRDRTAAARLAPGERGGCVYRTIITATLLAVVSLLAAGCGGAGTGTAAAGGPAASAAAIGTAGVGDSVSVAGNSSRLQITLCDTTRVPAETAGGVQVRPALFGTKLTIRNVDGSFYDDAISLCAVLTDARGRAYNAAWRLVNEQDEAFRDVLEGIRIPAGGERTGWVYFALDPAAEPASLRFTAEAGFGPETGVWTLR